MDKESLHILRLMGEIERNGNHSQRHLAKRLNISLGLVNTFLKRLVNKGYFKVKTMPRNRIKYFLTPAGLARKSRLTVEYLHYSIDFYKDIKKLLLNKYKDLEDKGIKKIIFWGSGEVAELAYLYLQMSNLRLRGVIDEKKKGKNFFEHKIQGMERLKRDDWEVILLTQLDSAKEDIEVLIKEGVSIEKIVTL